MAKRQTLPAMASAVIHRAREGMREVLIGKSPEPPHYGRWTFPHGRVEQGESPEAAMRRVLQSLLNTQDVHIIYGQPPFDHPWENVPHRWRFFFCDATDSHMENGYFAEIRWVPQASLREYEFDPVSQQVVDWLLDEPDDARS
jgi:ADP-ribose pyrophosphatase YjhB (NUDIX family)